MELRTLKLPLTSARHCRLMRLRQRGDLVNEWSVCPRYSWMRGGIGSFAESQNEFFSAPSLRSLRLCGFSWHVPIIHRGDAENAEETQRRVP